MRRPASLRRHRWRAAPPMRHRPGERGGPRSRHPGAAPRVTRTCGRRPPWRPRELDRERQVERADAATAALDSARRRDAMARQAAAAAPAPRTPEQRAGVYLRIGLDEAAKQLGRPVHVIEGMSRCSWDWRWDGTPRARTRPGRSCGWCIRTPRAGSSSSISSGSGPGQPTACARGRAPLGARARSLFRLGGEVGADILRNYRGRVR